MVSISSMVFGTTPPNSPTTRCAAPTIDFALLLKNPVLRISFASTSWRTAAKSRGVGYLAKRPGVTSLTRLSVHCAERMVATSKTLRDEILEMDGQKHDCWVVETKVGSMEIPQAAGAKVSDMVMTTWLDKKLGIDLQFAVSMKMEVAGNSIGMNQKMVKKNLKLDEPVPD